MTNNDSLKDRQPPKFPPLAQRILYVSETCVVVNKISGEAAEGAGKGQIDLPALLAPLLAANGNASDALLPPVAVHRLDVPVSGCVLFARTQEALAFLNAAFAGNAVQKRYWAIVEKPASSESLPESGELVHWLSFDTKHNKSFAADAPGQGRKRAELRYRLAGEGTNYLFVEIELITGRRHQIRAQLAALGLHIKGDLKYGAKRSEQHGGIRLHARSLAFPNPADGKPVSIIADPPLCDNLWRAFGEAAE